MKGFNIPFRQISQPITRTPLEVQPILDQKIQLQPNFSCSKEGRRYIFRRYANYRLLCPGDNAVYSDSDEPYLSGVHYSQGEINNNSNSNHHLSGVHHQFYHKTNKSTPREGNENLDTLPPNFDGRDGISSVACLTSRTTGVSPPSHLESSPAF